LAPNPQVSLTLNGQLTLTRTDEVITFVNRNLEPTRGYHCFMRALPEMLKRRPKARILIVGGDGVSYGAQPDPARYGNRRWKQIYLDEVRAQIPDTDWQRVHFLGNIPYQYFIPLLQLSTVHVYLTYPFVLSWSLLEAMSAGCAIVASDTAPLQEAIRHDETGRLVDFFDVAGLANAVCTLLDDPGARQRLGRNARAFAQAHYDLKRVCLPRQLAWVEGVGELHLRIDPDDLNTELAAIEAESIGWLPLGNGAYLHVGDTSKCPKRDFLRQMTQTLTKSCVEVALANAGS